MGGFGAMAFMNRPPSTVDPAYDDDPRYKPARNLMDPTPPQVPYRWPDQSEPQVMAPTQEPHSQQQQAPLTEEPQTADLATVTAPYRKQMDTATTSLQNKLDEYAQQPSYQPKHRSLGSRIGEAAVDTFLGPNAGNAIFERPEQERYQAYQANEGRQQRTVTALQHAAQVGERNLQLSQTGALDQSRMNYYNQRVPITDARTTDVVNPTDNKSHRYQFNPDSKKFDVDLGLSPKQSGDRAQNAIDLFQDDPAAFGRYEDTIEGAKAKHARAGQKPTDAEFRTNLYKSDPDTYRAVFGNQKGALDDDTMMRAATAMSKDELGDVDPDAVIENFGKLKDAAAKRVGGGAAGGGKAAPQKGDSKSYQGFAYTFDGRQWVRGQKAGRVSARNR